MESLFARNWIVAIDTCNNFYLELIMSLIGYVIDNRKITFDNKKAICWPALLRKTGHLQRWPITNGAGLLTSKKTNTACFFFFFFFGSRDTRKL